MSQCIQHHVEVRQLNIGNHLFAYFFSQTLKLTLFHQTTVTFSGIADLAMPPETGTQPSAAKEIIIKMGNHRPHLQELVRFSEMGSLHVKLMGPICNLGLMPPRASCISLVPGKSEAKARAMEIVSNTGDEFLWTHVRAADILRPIHKDYSPTPIAHIKKAAQITGRTAVFFGQTADSWYMDRLRQSFQEARVIPMQSPAVDFEILRSAKYIMLSASTFAWIAAWLSTRARLIVMPNHGFFDQQLRPDIDLASQLDSRYVRLSERVPKKEWYPSA